MPRRAGHFSASSDSSPYSSQDGIFPLSPARQSLNSSGSHALDGGPINSNPHTLLDMTPLSGSISSSVSGASVEDSESADGIDDGTSSTEDRAESSARLLRGHGHLSDTEGSFTSRLSSRAPSPLLGANSNQKKPSQLHIHHHHYHHDALRRTTAPNTPAPDESQEHVPDFFAHENYRSGRLARKLGFADMGIRKGQVATGLRSVASSPALASSWFGMNPSAYNKKTRRDSNINLDAPPSYFALTPDTSGPGLLPLCWPSVQKASRRFLRLPFVPTQPLTILFTLVIIISFILSSTTFVIHALNNDKAPLPWRTYCQEQAPFPHDYADSLDPVNVFVGVFSFDAAYERRHLIRSTYMRQSSPGPNVQVKFILGRPRPNHARRIALEMETYNDLVVLDTKENMNQGKTYSFFNWAAENATVPVYWRDARNQYGVGFQKADFVVKADDDAFLVLSELERHLRVAPREMTYWGYLIRNLFMGGEAYALSQDLVNYIATNPSLASVSSGAEDKKVARWMRMHPNMTSINWVTERCWIYDHPKAQTIYSHGYLFPDQVERIRLEGRRGLTPEEKARRGGDWAQSWSSVSEWKKAYSTPNKEMTVEEEVEALVEGGGLWGPEDGWKAAPVPKDQYLDWDKLHFASTDARLVNPKARGALPPGSKLPSLNVGANNNYPAATRVHKIGNDLFRDADEPIFPVKEGGVDLLPNPRQNFAQLPDNLPTYERLVPPPTLRYDAQRMALRDQRMLGRPHGGTVVVHFLKRHEWFLETSLALLGRHTTWDGGFAPYSSADSSSPPLGDASGDALWDGQKQVKMVDAATNWGTPRMYGSPLIRQNGYIAEGRESSFERLIKLPVDEQPKGKGVWGRLRGKPKLRLSDPDADDDEEDDSASEEDSSSASDEQTTASASSSNNSQVQPSSQPSSSLSSSQLEDSSADSESSTLAAPSFVVQPHHGQR